MSGLFVLDGLIATRKSTILGILKHRFQVCEEPVNDWIHLLHDVHDKNSSFLSQVSILTSLHKTQHQFLEKSSLKEPIILERNISGSKQTFIPNLLANDLISQKEFQGSKFLFRDPGSQVPGPEWSKFLFRDLGPGSWDRRFWVPGPGKGTGQSKFLFRDPGPGTQPRFTKTRLDITLGLGSRVPGPKEMDPKWLGPMCRVPPNRSRLLGPAHWVPTIVGSYRVGPVGWVPPTGSHQ